MKEEQKERYKNEGQGKYCKRETPGCDSKKYREKNRVRETPKKETSKHEEETKGKWRIRIDKK